jgi:formamidopyrimidine-DNA glycosylase
MENDTRVTFNDARRFGAMDLAPTAEVETHKMLASLGPEPLSNHLDDSYLAAALEGRNTPIKTALLDQRLIAGLGNIYVCEVLFRAKISPMRKAKNLSKMQVDTLVPIIRTVFQHSFHVYDRESQPCKHAGCGGIIARVSQSGRSSFYCPTCQR